MESDKIPQNDRFLLTQSPLEQGIISVKSISEMSSSFPLKKKFKVSFLKFQSALFFIEFPFKFVFDEGALNIFQSKIQGRIQKRLLAYTTLTEKTA